MTKNATKVAVTKPEKPYPDFPLFPHATNRWAKKIRQKLHYFGPWDDPEGSLEKYNREKDYLHNGKTPPAFEDGLTLKDLANSFLTAKRHLLDTREISPRTFADYLRTCERLTTVLDKNLLAGELQPADFAKLRRQISKSYGAIALGNEIQRIRTIFRFGYEDGLLKNPMRFGIQFKKPSKSVIRKGRNQKRQQNGERMFRPKEIHTILDNASTPLKAMILLGINCGYGQSDISSLPLSVIDLENGWIDFPRPKTGIERRCPLWKETGQALREAIAIRPKPKNPEDKGLAFITKYGHRWVKSSASGVNDDAISKELNKILKDKNIKRTGVGFYALRHGFQTVSEESRDHIAVKCVMGHIDDGMGSHYREHISDERLLAVVNTVHAWLFPEE